MNTERYWLHLIQPSKLHGRCSCSHFNCTNSFFFFQCSFLCFTCSFIVQNEYIKYPVLYELSHKYLNENLPESSLPDRLEELKEAIRKEIRKELKVSWNWKYFARHHFVQWTSHWRAIINTDITLILTHISDQRRCWKATRGCQRPTCALRRRDDCEEKQQQVGWAEIRVAWARESNNLDASK